MANHPYNQHREQQVAHRRVNTILSGSPAGAKKHAEGQAFSKITSKSAAVRDDDVRGHSAPKRYASGGKVKAKGDTTINIVIPGGGKPPMPPPPMPIGGPPPGPGPGLPPPGGMPGMPPGGPPPGMPMRASGGRVDGTATKAGIAKSAARAKTNSYMRGGAATGVGREEKAESAKRK